MKPLFTRLRPGKLARNGLSLLGWMLLRSAIQVATLIILTRQLGVQSYGNFVATVAVSSYLTPFAGLGLSHILLRNAARDPTHKDAYLQRALYWWVRSLPLCCVATVVLALGLLPAGRPLVSLCAIIVAELTVASLTEISARYWQARQMLNVCGIINAALPGVRLLALCILLIYQQDADLIAVVWSYVVSSLLYAALLWITLPSGVDGSDDSMPESITPENGIPFSLATFSIRLQGEFNKPMLAQAAFGLAGSYNVAQRAVDMVSLPLLALQEALWPRLYAQPDPFRQLRRTGMVLMVLALALSGTLWFVAPLLPVVAGEDFKNSAATLKMLAWLPPLQMLRALLNFDAIHHRRTKQIGWAYILGGAVSVIFVTLLVPMHGLVGAVWACYISEVAIILFLFFGSACTHRFSLP